MKTQRVNAYKNDNGNVFYIEQYDDKLKEWFIVSDTYDKLEYANASVVNYNLKELLNELAQ